MKKILSLVAISLLAFSCTNNTAQPGKTNAATTSSSWKMKVAPTKNYPPADETMATMEKVANYQIPRLFKLDHINRKKMRENSEHPRRWIQGAFYTGLTALADRSDNPFYEKWINFQAQESQWQLGKRPYHADDHIIGQMYIWQYMKDGDEKKIAPTKERFDMILANKPTSSLEYFKRTEHPNKPSCSKRWCWADALYMAPPTWFALSKVTGDPKYAEYSHAEFKAAMDYLYDPEIKLVYRDSRYKDRTGKYGEKIFWSRGMGWVMGGFANSLDVMAKDDPRRPYYEKHFKEMAEKLLSLQKKDGTWAASLLAGEKIQIPETSGTAFFTYAFTWGIKNGLLSKQKYWPSASKGWAALLSSIHPNGKLGWVQAIGDSPASSTYESTQVYAVGAFLLAGSMIYDLAKEN